jgi:hypothetical protein
MKRSFLFASMCIAAGLTLTNIYTSLVDVPAWSHNVPASIETTRQYFSASNPGTFFRIFSPINQLLGLTSLILFWKRSSQVRMLLIAALILYVTGEGLTFQYFYPRNAILFDSQQVDAGTLQSVLAEWRSMNWVRSAIIATGVICSALALNKTYLISPISRQSTPAASRPEVAMA